MKYFDHNILAIAFSTPINSYSFEIFPVIFCFLEKLEIDPLPKDIVAPVWHLQSSFTAYESPTHHFINWHGTNA